jgi:hypothetical protein
MDISAAFLTWAPRGISPRQILQGIASGLIGTASFRAGWASSALGLAIHFFIAFTAATVFYAASRKLPPCSIIPGWQVSAMGWWSTASCTGWSYRWLTCAASR